MRLNVRIKLNDFIGNGEEIVVEKLKQAWNQNKQFSVHFWYEQDSLKPKQIKDFISEYESELKFKTTITNGEIVKRGDFIWFNIGDRLSTSRFNFDGSGLEGIMQGLKYFSDIIDFMFTTKPAKQMSKQKRNDNESSDSRE